MKSLGECEVVLLSDLEVKFFNRIGQLRYENDLKAGLTDKKISNSSDLEVSQQGAVVEGAWAKYLNVYPDLNVTVRKFGAELIHHDWSLDAKWCSMRDNGTPHDNVLLPQWKTIEDAEIYAFTVGKNPYYLLGWCFNYDIIHPDNKIDIIKNDKKIPSYILSRNKLYDTLKLKTIPFKM